MRRRSNHCVFLLAVALAWACDGGPVRWSDAVATPMAASGETELTVDSTGRTSWRTVPQWPMRHVPGACDTSMRARAGTRAFYGVWWSVRADSGALLYAGRSPDSGATWRRTIVVDSADASTVGCRRPAPSIAVVGDDVYVAYAMKAVDGTGVFFAHSLDGGAMFHSPVPIVYGDRLVPTAVASDGQRVAVAYEEPNGATRSVGVAVSRTQGHIFEARAPASAPDKNIISPYVAIAGSAIAVGWTLPASADHGLWSVTRVGRTTD